MSRKERILYALKQVGINNINQLGEDHGSKMYAKLYRQLFSQQDFGVTLEVVEYVLEKFPNISAYYIINGEGPWERTKILTPPQHRQDIHVNGGTAAISQSGSATVDAPQVEQTKEPDIAQMIRDNDLGGLVAIIMQQKDEIIRLKEQRIHDLETSVRIADANLFPPVK